MDVGNFIMTKVICQHAYNCLIIKPPSTLSRSIIDLHGQGLIWIYTCKCQGSKREIVNIGRSTFFNNICVIL